MMARAESCVVCGKPAEDGERLVLVSGKRHERHCSAACLRASVRKRQLLNARARWRWSLRISAALALLIGGDALWHRFHAQAPRTIAFEPPESRPAPVKAPEPIYFGPAWPPTDEDWLIAFGRASWVYPLPGPVRRLLTIDDRVFGPDPPADRPATCRTEGHCGVDLGGELWGEHVYAALDGVVDRVQRGTNDEHGGEYVRIAHFGGMAFTQYFHLAAVPRTLGAGSRVRAGDVIGLVGDTGIKGSGRHLHFALSVRPSSDFPEIYWDPKPWMASWRLQIPPHGTVAGLTPANKEGKSPTHVR